MSYIGRGIDQIDNISTLDNLSFNGSDATFNLTQNGVAFTPVSADALQIQIDGIIQSGNFSVSSSTVTFDFTPSGSSVCNGIKHFGVGVLTTPSDNSVGITQLNVSDGTNGQALTTNGSGTLAFADVGVSGISSSADATAMTIDSSENVLVGKTSSNGSIQGVEARANGSLLATRDGDWVQQVRRLTDDGDLVRYYKDTTQVGAIATNSGGISITLGGTGASNTLDDYEEGSFVPSWTVTGATLNSVANNYANYTKIGSLVHVDFGAVLVTSSGTPSRYNVTNMPYQANQNAVGSGYEYGQTGTMQMCNIDPNSTTVFMRKYDGGNIASAYLKMSITYQTSA